MTKKILLLQVFVCYCLTFLMSQATFPKREFRAAWVATVLNIDFPSKGVWDKEAQQQEWIRILDTFKALNFNAVIFQVRPAADALYASKYEPWSAYLTGKQGQAPKPYYDPLTFLIEECHKRSLEFHAWLNPYRGTLNDNLEDLAQNHPLRTHPERFFKYGNKYYFNPARQDVRNHITDVITDIVENYDVDGIHFDDYFYPYKIKDEVIPDEKDFLNNRRNFQNIEDWRRSRVSLMIEQVSKKIKSIKPYVQFGISPFGVWRNRDKDPERGSDTRAGVTSYDDLYADILKWLENDWIDYVAPQIYWHLGHPAADFQTLAEWWNENSYGKNVYIGHAAYKVASDSYVEWHQADELFRQIVFSRDLNQIKGSIFYNTSSLRKNPLNIQTSLQRAYAPTALIPKTADEATVAIQSPKFRKVKKRKNGLRLKWKQKGKLPFYYVVYRFKGEETGDFNNPQNIWHISPFYPNKKVTLYDVDYQSGQDYTYVVASVGRGHVERLSRGRSISKP